MNKPNRGFCENFGLYRIQLRQLDDLRRAVFKIEPNFAPFAVARRLIQVDSGGYFFVLLAALGLLQRVTVWITPLSSSFSRSLSNVRR